MPNKRAINSLETNKSTLSMKRKEYTYTFEDALSANLLHDVTHVAHNFAITKKRIDRQRYFCTVITFSGRHYVSNAFWTNWVRPYSKGDPEKEYDILWQLFFHLVHAREAKLFNPRTYTCEFVVPKQAFAEPLSEHIRSTRPACDERQVKNNARDYVRLKNVSGPIALLTEKANSITLLAEEELTLFCERDPSSSFYTN